MHPSSPSPKMSNGQAQGTQCLHKLGPLIWVQPTKAQVHSHFLFGPFSLVHIHHLGLAPNSNSITCLGWAPTQAQIFIFSIAPLHFRRRRRRNWRWEASPEPSKLVQAARFTRRRLDYRHPCRVRHRVPASAFMRGARNYSLVSAPEDGASSRDLYRRVRGFLGRTWPSGGEFATCVADNAAAIEFL